VLVSVLVLVPVSELALAFVSVAVLVLPLFSFCTAQLKSEATIHTINKSNKNFFIKILSS
jgi:hypothetical protein